jgi:hypothetical protein
MKRISWFAFAGLALGAAMLAGCRVEKTRNGDSKDVNIVTPFGGVQVKTNNADPMSDIGLPAYPGATVVKDMDDHKGSADVNMSFGGFQMRVKTAKFRTGDAPAKVEAFYRDGMKRYGDVIACREGHAIGMPSRTTEGLTCDKDHGWNVDVRDHPTRNGLALKAGSKQHQHSVSIDADGTGTAFSVVALDLPSGASSESDDTRQ